MNLFNHIRKTLYNTVGRIPGSLALQKTYLTNWHLSSSKHTALWGTTGKPRGKHFLPTTNMPPFRQN
jgi:hypothetical protein